MALIFGQGDFEIDAVFICRKIYTSSLLEARTSIRENIMTTKINQTKKGTMNTKRS